MEGITPANAEEMRTLAERFYSRLCVIQPDPRTRSVFVLFKDVDADGSGRITYDEFLKVVRKGLGMGPAELAERWACDRPRGCGGRRGERGERALVVLAGS